MKFVLFKLFNDKEIDFPLEIKEKNSTELFKKYKID